MIFAKTKLFGCLLLVGLLHLAQGHCCAEDRVYAEGHAHNDYWQIRPLQDALRHGFTSVEADVFLEDGQLLVGHARFELRPGRTLQSLYLEPLRKTIAEQGGSVYGDDKPFMLLVDVKSDAVRTYEALREVLAEYADILTTIEDGEVTPGAVDVVISGGRDYDQVAADKLRHAGVDGRIADLGKSHPTHLMPLVSDHWPSHFTWRGLGEMPEDEREKLRDIVARTRAEGKRLRFWATPENPTVWQELYDAQVDLIGTDTLEALAEFLEAQKMRHK